MAAPHILAVGGTLNPQSSTARAMRRALDVAEARGARVTLLTGDDIVFPPYEPEAARGDAAAARFVTELRSADALLIGSPGYHGTLSGLVKNMLDHVEMTRGDARPYLDGLPVGLIATAGGWQAAVTTLATLRGVVHALRGWPTPLGIAANTGEDGWEDALDRQLPILIDQILAFHGAFAQARRG